MFDEVNTPQLAAASALSSKAIPIRPTRARLPFLFALVVTIILALASFPTPVVAQSPGASHLPFEMVAVTRYMKVVHDVEPMYLAAWPKVKQASFIWLTPADGSGRQMWLPEQGMLVRPAQL